MRFRRYGPDSAMREELSRLLPAPLERDMPRERHDALKDHLTRAVQRAAPAAARPRSRRTVLVAAGAAALTAGAMMVLPGTPGAGGTGTEPQRVHAMTVAQVLDAAALNAAKGPGKEPGPRQWIYADAVMCMPQCHHSPSWSRYDGAKSATLGRTPGTGDKIVVVVDDADPRHATGRLGDQPRETREVLSRLPRDPRQLLQQVSTDAFFEDRLLPGPAVTPGAQFSRILSILQTASSTPPAVDAALYRALALIPGTKVVGKQVRDAAGRAGLAIEFDTRDRSATREYLILDPKTYAYLGYRRDWHGARDFSDSFARVATGVVDRPGQVPGGPAPDPSNVVERPFVPVPGSL